MSENSAENAIAPEAVTAAKWWGDQLRHGARLNNGDESEMGDTAMMLGLLAQQAARQSNDMSEERITQFEDALAKMINTRLAHGASRGVTISVDYHPDSTLVEAAETVGINAGMTMFPWKTMMWIKLGSVSVSSGYGSSIKELEII